MTIQGGISADSGVTVDEGWFSDQGTSSQETAFVPPFNIEVTMLSQYANSPVISTLKHFAKQWFDPTANIQAFYAMVWNLASAQGFGLDIWGRILRVSRYLQIPNQQQYFGFAGALGAPFGVAPFYIGGSSSSTYQLPDALYLTLLIAKAFVNLARVSIPALNQLSQMVFGTGAMCVLDLGTMQMAYVFAATPSAVNSAIVESSGVFPYPTGVLMNVRTALLFNASLVAAASGSDTGYGSGYGSLSPAVDVNGNAVSALYSAAGDIVLTISSASTLVAGYFNDLTLNGVSLAASAATFVSGSGTYTWTWSGESALVFTSGDTYTILIS